MADDRPLLLRALAAIDAANEADPVRVEHAGRSVASQVLYAERMSAALDRVAPGASEALRLAVRAQHLERWALPRDRFPRDRAGYLRWRAELGRHHGARLAEILSAQGYDPDTIARARRIVEKRGLGRDPEVQALEDCACLVFLEHHLEDFAREHDDEKVVSILRKTWAKASPRARELARAVPLGARSATLAARALGE